MSKVYSCLAILVVLASLTGCATFKEPFAPAQSFDIDDDIQQLEERYGVDTSVTGYYAGTQDNVTRNEFITGRLALTNLQYVRFVRSFSADKAQLDTAMDMLQLGVDLAITVVGGASVKAALGAASAGITGTRTSIDKNFFLEKTVPVLITAMNAARKETLLPILTGIGSSIDDYPFAEALSDLQAYYFAGTFIGGLQAIQKDSGAKEAKADVNIEMLRLVKFQPVGDTGKRIKAWALASDANKAALNEWLGRRSPGVPIPHFFRLEVFEAKRAEIISDLSIP